MKRHILLFVGIVLTIGWWFAPNEYMEFYYRKCIVTDKLETAEGYKRSGYFYLVLQEEKTGRYFDLIVSPATWSRADVGETITFNLRDMDIKQTVRGNVIYFFGYCLWLAIAICLLILGIIVSFNMIRDSYRQRIRQLERERDITITEDTFKRYRTIKLGNDAKN